MDKINAKYAKSGFKKEVEKNPNLWTINSLLEI